MNRRQPPRLPPAAATEMLALIDHALVAAPEGPLPYLRGFLVARSWEPREAPAPVLAEPDFLGEVG